MRIKYINHFIVRETALLFLMIAPVVLSARFLSLISIHSIDSSFFIYFLEPKNLYADFWSAILFIIIAFVVSFSIPNKIKIRRMIQGVLLFIFCLFYIVSRKYHYIYKTEFDWSHIGPEKIEAGLLTSMNAEFDSWVIVSIIFSLLYCLIFIYASIKSQFTSEAKSKTNAQHGFQKPKYYLILVYMLLLVFGMILYLNYNQSTFDSHYEDSPEGNVLLNLFLFPLVNFNQGSRQPDNLVPNVHATQDFKYHFLSDSITDRSIKPPLPFANQGKKLNIVFYFMESVAHKYIGKVGANGVPITPNFDKLSKTSFVFQKHYVNNPLSINALFNVLTSAYSFPSDRWVAKEFPDISLESLPQILKKSGYQNAVYHSGYLAYAGAGRFLKNRSFDEIKDVTDLISKKYKKVNWGVDDRAFIEPSLLFAQKQADKPFFIIYLPISPHHPYETPDERYPIKVPKDLSPGHGHSFRQYLNSLNYSDKVLMQTIDAYKKAGLLKNTVFFIFADHGEAFGQHRRNYNHPFYIYEENVHVPFIIYSPHLIQKQVFINSISRHIDIMPTVLDILNLPISKKLEGKSLLSSYKSQFAALHTSWRNDFIGLRDGKYKYIYNQVTKKEELYDLEIDLVEKNNIVNENLELANKFKLKLIQLKSHQMQFFERTLSQKIDWNKIQDKENY